MCSLRTPSFRRVSYTVLAIAFEGLSAARAACPGFATPVAVPAHTDPRAVVTGDFNRDGKLDLAVANGSSNDVSIALGNGDGTYHASVNYTAGNQPVAIVAADFNRDGKQDLAVADTGSSTSVSILIGNGDGSFNAPYGYNGGVAVSSIAAADFNNDGIIDIAAASSSSGGVSILLLTPTGTLQTLLSFVLPGTTHYIGVGDFNRDGKADLALAGSTTNVASIMLGVGNGTFTAASPRDYAVGTTPGAVVVGDFDRNGKADIAVANLTSGNISVLLGNGSGGFATAVAYRAGVNPASIAAADVNADGISDLMTADNGSNDLSVLTGNANGTFNGSITLAMTTSPRSVVAGNMNGDTYADLIAVSSAGASFFANTSLCEGRCGSLSNSVNYYAGANIRSIAACDINRDGKIDIVVPNGAANTVTFLPGSGDGTFGAGTSFATGQYTYDVITADFNLDGKPDLATVNFDANTISVLIGNGGGTFGAHQDYAVATSPTRLAAGDFNRDGKPDVVVTSTGSISILLGSGTGSFAPANPATYALAGVANVAVADIDRDGKQDIVADVPNAFCVLAGNGDGTFHSPVNYAIPHQGIAGWINAGDLNGDGRPDLEARGFVLLGTDSGFSQPISPTRSFGSDSLADVTQDGRLDIAAVDFTNKAGIFEGRGDGTFFTPASFYAIGTTPIKAIAADFNGDGKPDVAVANQDSGNVSILLNSCPPPDLTVRKTHTGSFAQAGTGTYTVEVTNSGLIPTSGTITLRETPPEFMSLLSMNGTSWACDVPSKQCTSTSTVAAGAALPPITVGVTIANNAPDSLTNTVSVSGGGEVNETNDAGSDTTPIVQYADLTITSSHAGAFAYMQPNTYTITVTNVGHAPTTGGVQAFDDLPAHVYPLAASGTGWTCVAPIDVTCTRADVLAAGESYPPVIVTVNPAASPGTLNNVVSVTTTGEVRVDNNSFIDATLFIGPSDLTVQKTHAGDFKQGQIGASYTLVVSNAGAAPTLGTIRVTDNVPYYLTATAMSGSGWTCDVSTATCSRDDALAAGAAFPPIVLTVSVATDAPNTGTNTAVASGGAEVDSTNNTATDLTTIAPVPDLHIYKSHSTPFAQGQSGQTYTITASNLGLASTIGTVSVTDTLPAGLTATAIQGDNWNCTLATLTCQTDAVVPSMGAYPPITLTVNVSSAAPPSVTNTVTVSGGGETNTGNDSATDVTPIAASPDLTMTKTHSGMFRQGDRNLTYKLHVTNAGSAATVPGISVVVRDTVPAGLTATAISGPGWACGTVPPVCTTFVPLSPGASYQDITLTVDVASDASATLSNTATVSGGGEYDTSNDSATDLTSIAPMPDLAVTKTHSGIFRQGDIGDAYTIVVSNRGDAATTNAVSVWDSLPEGLTVTAMSGNGWTCTTPSLTCFRSDALAAHASYPAITLTVNVATNARASVTNSVTVSGGGEINSTNDTGDDLTIISPILVAPTAFTATATTTTEVTLSWTVVPGAVRYDVLRRTSGDVFDVIGTSTLTTYTDLNRAENTAYVYVVRGVDSSGHSGAFSDRDVATTTSFVDQEIVRGQSRIQAAHIERLRSAVTAIRTAAGQACTFGHPVAPNDRVLAADITELRTRIDEARAALGLWAVAYTDPVLSNATAVKADHILELRAAVK